MTAKDRQLDDRREDYGKSQEAAVLPSLPTAGRGPGASVFGAFQSQKLITPLADAVATAMDGVLADAPLIIDCGSGDGRLAEALLDRLPEPGMGFVLMDVDREAVVDGVNRLRNRLVAGLCADVEALPLRIRQRSVLLLSHVLYYIRDREALNRPGKGADSNL